MTDIVDALERLARLRAAGALTDAEFEAQKAALIRSAQGSQASTASFGERYAEAKRETRGIRLFIRWLFGLILVAIVLVGIYFLTRGYTIEEQRQSVANVMSAELPGPAAAELSPDQVMNAHPITSAPVASRAPDGATTEIDDVLITEQVVRSIYKSDGSFAEGSSQGVCPFSTIRIINRTQAPLDLDISSAKTAELVGEIGHLEPGQSASYRTGQVGRYIIGKLQQGVSINMFLLDVRNCVDGD